MSSRCPFSIDDFLRSARQGWSVHAWGLNTGDHCVTRQRTIGSLQVKPSGSGDENGESLDFRALLRMTTRDLYEKSDAGVKRQEVWGG